MVKIRLLRVGAKKRPFYRVVAIDERRQRNGRALEFLGTYDPKTDPATLKIDVERVDSWLARGARLTETARSVLERARRNPPPQGDATVA